MSPCRRCRTEWSCGNGSELCRKCYLERVKEEYYPPPIPWTLWDFFAAHALSSFDSRQFSPEEIAENAAIIADELLAERAKRGIK